MTEIALTATAALAIGMSAAWAHAAARAAHFENEVAQLRRNTGGKDNDK